MSLYLKHQFDNDNKILGIWRISESEDTLRKVFHEVGYNAGNSDLNHLEVITNQKRRKEWLSTRILIYHLFYAPQKIGYTENRKPYLADKSYHISISHSQGLVAVLLSLDGRAGLDVEMLSEKVCRISHKFLTEKEIEDAGTDNIRKLSLYWGAKEALYKLHGNEEISLRESLLIKPFQLKNIGKVYGTIINGHKPEEHTIHYFFFADYVTVWTD